MTDWKQYLISVVVCVFSYGITAQIVSDNRKKTLVHLVGGIILAITLLNPLSKINPGEFAYLSADNLHNAELYILEGEKAASEARAECIIASCESYVLNKAKSLGAVITAQFALDEKQVPVSVKMKGEGSLEMQKQLQTILTMDLGIPKENQQWIWNQESNSS